jgi:hypothetical protein
MARIAAFASILAVTILAPSVGFAQNSETQVPHKAGNSIVNPKDPASVQACLDAKGKVQMKGDKTICKIPRAKAAGAAPTQ